MQKVRATESRKSSQTELSDLIAHAEEQLPGITELLQVYGGYQEMIQAVQQYLEVTRPQPFITTSNQSSPQQGRSAG